ncbi:hypothetical protein GPJ56_006936 [Histomonas meleagridis]|uniref:uncharacterized protein n=1 Tax=Histomonas meleagridis TaxID=135588 RepID=UPI0035599E5A|nr:hypothetical protein GPJ56_006936 [Histomonas meleagridis]KAH0802206.1 hypothetical protein GO595_004819 [Histomonas meleagridis]
MNNLLCSACIEHFNQALRSPIGQALTSYFNSLENQPPDEINIFIVKLKLDENKYKTPEEWLNELHCVVQRAINFFGTDSEITLALLSIQKSIIKSVKPYLQPTETTWHESLLTFKDIFSQYISICPNDIQSFNDFTALIPPPHPVPLKAPAAPVKQQSSSIDIYELKDLIQRQITDKDLEYLGSIVSRYEHEFSKAKGLVDCDLKKLRSITQKLLYEYASKHAAPKRVPNSMPPRIKSTPLPPSIVANLALQKTKNITETSPFLTMGNKGKSNDTSANENEKGESQIANSIPNKSEEKTDVK